MHDQTTTTHGKMPLQHGDRSPQKEATLTSNIGALRPGKRSQHQKKPALTKVNGAHLIKWLGAFCVLDCVGASEFGESPGASTSPQTPLPPSIKSDHSGANAGVGELPDAEIIIIEDPGDFAEAADHMHTALPADRAEEQRRSLQPSPSPKPSPSPEPDPRTVYGQTPVTSTTGFTQQKPEYGCSYQSKNKYYMKDYGAMQWLDCAKEASKRQLMMHAGYNSQNVWGWAVLNPSRTHAQTGRWATYQSATVGSSLSCQLSRDKDSLSQYSISLSDTTWLQADVDIGGVSVRWRYKDFGTSFSDQCMEFASRAGASITTPDTLGITWPSGTKYWIPSGHLCNTYQFMSALQSGTSFSYSTKSNGARSTATVSCLAAFIEGELPSPSPPPLPPSPPPPTPPPPTPPPPTPPTPPPPPYPFTSTTALKTAVQAYDVNPAAAVATYGPLADWDVSAVIDMSYLFKDLKDFNADVSSWDTSSVTTMEYMFYVRSARAPAPQSCNPPASRPAPDPAPHRMCPHLDTAGRVIVQPAAEL